MCRNFECFNYLFIISTSYKYFSHYNNSKTSYNYFLRSLFANNKKFFFIYCWFSFHLFSFDYSVSLMLSYTLRCVQEPSLMPLQFSLRIRLSCSQPLEFSLLLQLLRKNNSFLFDFVLSLAQRFLKKKKMNFGYHICGCQSSVFPFLKLTNQYDLQTCFFFTFLLQIFGFLQGFLLVWLLFLFANSRCALTLCMRIRLIKPVSTNKE